MFWKKGININTGNLKFALFNNEFDMLHNRPLATYELESKLYSKEIIESKWFQETIIKTLKEIESKVEVK